MLRSGGVALPFSSVVSLHTNEFGCGVAKFSKELARHLGVPFVGLRDCIAGGSRFPLFSLKMSELDMMPYSLFDGEYGVFWHDVGDHRITRQAKIVYHADPSLGPNGLWCPSLLTPSKPRTVRLFSFGMAGRLQLDQFEDVKALLQVAGLDYQLRVSSGLHEGTSLADAMHGFDDLSTLMGPDRVTFLGILSDAALLEEIHAADYVLSFFKGGVKANNTTVHAALDAGAKVITNGCLRDAINLDELQGWPMKPSPYSWGHLIASMERIYAKSTDWQSAHI